MDKNCDLCILIFLFSNKCGNNNSLGNVLRKESFLFLFFLGVKLEENWCGIDFRVSIVGTVGEFNLEKFTEQMWEKTRKSQGDSEDLPGCNPFLENKTWTKERIRKGARNTLISFRWTTNEFMEFLIRGLKNSPSVLGKTTIVHVLDRWHLEKRMWWSLITWRLTTRTMTQRRTKIAIPE